MNIKTTRYSLLFLFSLFSSFLFCQIPVEDKLNNADSYVDHTWSATDVNIKKVSCGGKTVAPAPWVVKGENESIPYCWGGYSTLSQFDTGIKNGKVAGDITISTVALSCTEGVDCSGFVSRVWETKRYTTSSFPSVTKQHSSFTELKAGDILNKAGSHVRMAYEINPNGSITTVESAQGASQGGTDGLWKVFFWTYSYSDLQAMTAEGYIPRYWSDGTNEPETPECSDCDKAEPLTVSENPSYKIFSVTGAKPSGIAIPECSGYTSSAANDLWFSFTASSTSQTIIVDPTEKSGYGLDAVVAIYEDCSASTFINCIDVSGGGGLKTKLTYDAFEIGKQYLIRVFDYGSVPPENGGFKIAVINNKISPCIDNFEPNNKKETATPMTYSNKTQIIKACLDANDIDYFILSGLDAEKEYTANITIIGSDNNANAVINNTNTTFTENFLGNNPSTFFIQSSDNSTGNYSLSITIEEKGAGKEEYYVILTTSEYGAGTTSGAGLYTEGDTVWISAIANEGYFFKQWESNGAYYSKYETGWFVAQKNMELVAVFEEEHNTDIEYTSENMWKVYPTPAQDYIIIENDNSETTSYQIISAVGQIVLQGKFESKKHEIDISNLQTGNYFIITKQNSAPAKPLQFIKL